MRCRTGPARKRAAGARGGPGRARGARTSRLSGSEPTGRPAIAIDGKDVRGASQADRGRPPHRVAAVEHEHGLVLGQVEVAAKTNEIGAAGTGREIDCAGRVITADAMHAQQETARHLLGEGAHYVITAVKDNQPTILDDLQHMDFAAAPPTRPSTRGTAASKPAPTRSRTLPLPNGTTTPSSTAASRRSASCASGR